jgi:dihydrofolate reductase
MSGFRFEAYAIVSADGMLADALRHMPEQLHIAADQRVFTEALDRAALVVHGAHSHEQQGAASDGRRRVVLTRTVSRIAVHPVLPNTILWNPEHAPFRDAANAMGVAEGLVVVSGAAQVFAHFLRQRSIDAFHLTRVATVTLPGGRPVLPGVPAETPEQILARHGLEPAPGRVLDARAGATLVTWAPPAH